MGDRRYSKLWPLWMGIFSDVTGYSVIAVMLPYLSVRFGITPLDAALLLSANAGAALVCGPILSGLSDHYGRRPLLLISLAGTIAAFTMLALATSFLMVLLSRIIDGVFSAVFPIVLATIPDIVPVKDRPLQNTNVHVAITLAELLAPSLASVFIVLGLVGPAIASIVISVMAFIATWKRFPKPLHTQEKTPEKTVIKLRDRLGLVWMSKGIRILIPVYFLISLGFATFYSNLSLFAFYRLGLGTEVLGLYFTMGAIFSLIFRYGIYPRMLRRLKMQGTLLTGFVLFILTYLSVGLVSQPWMFVGVLLFNNLSGMCIWGLLDTRVSELVVPQGMGTISGINSVTYQTASVFGPLISGWTLTFLSASSYGIMPTGFMILAFCITLGLRGLIFQDTEIQ